MTWADGGDERCIFWLNGMAGTGKSTLARTVARKYYDQNRLGASFFFSKGGGDVSNAGKFFTSIAVQLAETSARSARSARSAALKRCICEAIAEHSNIANQALRDQWNQLIFQPLSKQEADSLPSPLLIVIDALDECEGENNIRAILQLLVDARALKTTRLRIFITSRPETPIHLNFRAIPEICYYDLVLHDVSRAIVDNDISIFFKHNLGIIREMCSLPADWPDKQTITRLVQSAGGLFIWAATACRYICDGDGFFGQERLLDILEGDSSAAEPEEELNNIYIKVLENSVNPRLKPQEKERFFKMLREALGAIILLISPLPAISLARLLRKPEDKVGIVLGHLRSILHIAKDPSRPVRLHHPSLRDFLLSPQRCRNPLFWVDEKKANEALANHCIQLMSEELKRNICGLTIPSAKTIKIPLDKIKHCLSAELQYACQYWVDHLQRSDAQFNDDSRLHYFLQEHLLHWLEVLGLIRRITQGVLAIASLENMVKVRKA
jgi:AAA ATPase domain